MYLAFDAGGTDRETLHCDTRDNAGTCSGLNWPMVSQRKGLIYDGNCTTRKVLDGNHESICEEWEAGHDFINFRDLDYYGWAIPVVTHHDYYMKVIPHCCPLRLHTTPSPEEKSIPGVTYGVLLRADMNAATALGACGAWGRSVMSFVHEV